MNEGKMKEAFSTYNAKATRRARSAMTADGNLVMSCWYGGFKKAEANTLRYEEDLSGHTDQVATAFRAHLADALSRECEVHVIVAIAPDANAGPDAPAGYANCYAREDLIGRVFSFDGDRLVVNFRKIRLPETGKPAKGRSN
jgi:hypothetical protein